MDYRKYIAEKLKIENVTEEEISSFIEIPPDANMGDYALPCFKLSKILRSSPIAIAENLANSFSPDDVIESCSALKGYLNFKINRKGFAAKTLESVLIEKEKYGSDDI